MKDQTKKGEMASLGTEQTVATVDVWTAPKIVKVGRLGDLLKAGGGKITMAVDGDGRKPNLQS